MDGESHRSRSGQRMFTEPNNKTPFGRLRFDVDSLVSPLGGDDPRSAGGPLSSGGAVADGEGNGRRFGMPADPLLDDFLKYSPTVPLAFADRLHQLIDELPEDTVE